MDQQPITYTATTTSRLARKHVYVTQEQSDGISERSGSGNVSTYLRDLEECYSMTLACAKVTLADLLQDAGASEAERALIISRIYDALVPTDPVVSLHDFGSLMRDCPSCSYTHAKTLHMVLSAMGHPSGGNEDSWGEAVMMMCSGMLPLLMMLAWDAKTGISVGTAQTHLYTTSPEITHV